MVKDDLGGDGYSDKLHIYNDFIGVLISEVEQNFWAIGKYKLVISSNKGEDWNEIKIPETIRLGASTFYKDKQFIGFNEKGFLITVNLE